MIAAGINGNVTMPDPPKAARRFVNGDEILGRYVVQAELGQGGMGVVYRCFDKIGGVEVAVKGLPPEVSHNADEMEAVRDNFQLVHELHHPNIASVLTLEQDAATGDYYLVMTLARGVSLRHWLRQHGGKEHRAEQLAVLRQIASALDYAHNAEPKHIIHRDIKPENVMVDEHGNVAVLDFGLAAQVRSSLSRVSQVVASRSGTPAYKSPEQWLAQAQRAPSDQYSLGVIAYQMFAGELPYDSDDIEILKHAVVFDPVPPIPGEGKSVNAVFAKVLAKKPQERFASCAAFVAALEGKTVAERSRANQEEPKSNGMPELSTRSDRLRRWVGYGAVVLWLMTLALMIYWRCYGARACELYAPGCAYLGFVPCETKLLEQGMGIVWVYPYIMLLSLLLLRCRKGKVLSWLVRGVWWFAVVLYLLALILYGCEGDDSWGGFWSALALLLLLLSSFGGSLQKSNRWFSLVANCGLCLVICCAIAHMIGLLRLSKNPFGEVLFCQFLSLVVSLIYIVLASFHEYDCGSVIRRTVVCLFLLGVVLGRFCLMPQYDGSMQYEFVHVMRSVKIPKGVTNIGELSFSSCRFLRDVDIPHSVTNIDLLAFYDCKALEYVSIPSSVKHIGECAFRGCESLKFANIPNSVTNIGSEAFAECENLRHVSIPSSVAKIRNGVFFGCRSLTSVKIPSSVKSIGCDAFEGCTSLTTLEMPSCEMEIGLDAFENCSKLRTVRSENPDRTRKLKWKKAGVDVDKIIFEGM